jgi:FG-GAP repeat
VRPAVWLLASIAAGLVALAGVPDCALAIDPLIQSGAKLGTSNVTGSSFGWSVALAADGNTGLIGASGPFGTTVGDVWVFTRSGSGSLSQASELAGAGEVGDGQFGQSVALSADGSTALVGGSGDDQNRGAVWVFRRSGSTWTQEGPKLTGAGEVGAGGFGWSVALSADGNTALVGGPYDNRGAGAVWVFTNSGTSWTWSQQGPKLRGRGESGAGNVGGSVALAANGNTALIGGYSDDHDRGAAWMFTRTGAMWAQDGPKLTGRGESGPGGFGDVALSGDGDTALIGAEDDNSSLGAVWTFSRSGAIWTQQGAKLKGPGEASGGDFGASVALSQDGSRALVGAPGTYRLAGTPPSSDDGAAWVFDRSRQSWQLAARNEVGAGNFGWSVALSSDGSSALIGGPGDHGQAGAAWPFTSVPAATPALAGLRISPRAFPLLHRGHTRTGATITYTDSLSGATTVRVLRMRRGVLLGGKCVTASATVKRLKRCVHQSTVDSFTHLDVAGVNHLHFSGRLIQTINLGAGVTETKSSVLATGDYRLQATATFGGAPSNVVSAEFRVLRAHR